MINHFVSKKILALIAVVGLILIVIFQGGLTPPSSEKPVNPVTEQSDEVKLLSTTPANLEGSIVLPAQIISVTFSHPIENAGEFKHHFEPDVPHTVKLSDDHKTVTIAGDPTFRVGASYTLFISNETKFTGGKRLRDTQYVHFRTIDYKGV